MSTEQPSPAAQPPQSSDASAPTLANPGSAAKRAKKQSKRRSKQHRKERDLQEAMGATHINEEEHKEEHISSDDAAEEVKAPPQRQLGEALPDAAAEHKDVQSDSTQRPPHSSSSSSKPATIPPSSTTTAKSKAGVAKIDYTKYLERIDNVSLLIKKGMVPNMNVDGLCYCNDTLLESLYDELAKATGGSAGGFSPALKQVANVASLPGIVGRSLAMPDIHSGYGFSIGGVAAFDMDDPDAVVSPGGVGYDINCGVRLIRTNLKRADINQETIQKLADTLYAQIPVGVGRSAHAAKGGWQVSADNLDTILQQGMEFVESEGMCWPEDRQRVEATGCIPGADPTQVSKRAKQRGLPQAGSLGSGNHYVEVQVIDKIMPGAEREAEVMGLQQGNLVIMLHSGSRGLGHQVCTDHLQTIEEASRKQKIKLNDRQLAAVKINSAEGKNYLSAMAAAANFAFVNRSIMTHHIRTSFAEVFKKDAKTDLDMHIVYDVCHNIAKIEEHTVDGKQKRVLVHRKGATRAFPPGHAELPAEYQEVGQPVLIGGSMGTESWVLTGTHESMKLTFGSTCHGAGRALSRSASMKQHGQKDVEDMLSSQGITIRVANRKMIAEEAPHAYKDVAAVVESCEQAGFSKRVARLKPVAVIKG